MFITDTEGHYQVASGARIHIQAGLLGIDGPVVGLAAGRQDSQPGEE